MAVVVAMEGCHWCMPPLAWLWVLPISDHRVGCGHSPTTSAFHTTASCGRKPLPLLCHRALLDLLLAVELRCTLKLAVDRYPLAIRLCELQECANVTAIIFGSQLVDLNYLFLPVHVWSQKILVSLYFFISHFLLWAFFFFSWSQWADEAKYCTTLCSCMAS